MAEAVAPGSGKERPIGFFGLMRNRNYALLWWGQLVSEFGNRLHWVAISLWVYSATHSASAVSLAVSSMFIGGLLVSLWAGVLVDWFDRKRILVIADLVRALLVALIPLLMGIDIWLVYLDLALISVATAFFRPAMFAVIPAIVSRRNLLPANSFFTAMDTGTEIIGPAIAGVIAFSLGYAPLLYLDAATYVFSAICLLGTSVPLAPQVASRRVRWNSVTASVTEGLRYIRRDGLQWGLFVLIFPAYLVGSGLNALQTPLAKGVIGISDAEFGTFNSVWGVGFVTASLAVGWFGSRVKKSQLILGGFFLGFASAAAMSSSNSLNTLLATAFAVGFANTLNYVGLTTVLMEHTPQGLIGRVMSTRQVALGATRILSPLIFGVIGDAWGVRQAILGMAIVGAIGTAVVAIVNPVLRRFDRSVEPPRPSGVRHVWEFLISRTSPEFDTAQQSALNSVTIGIVLVAWVGLALRVPIYATGILLTVLGLAYFGSAAVHRLWPPFTSRSLEQLFGDARTWSRSRGTRKVIEGNPSMHTK